ncbi:sulfatase [Maricurvus nonylphenolicus]|uniref:sulfatase n=1 Tax=Maricurvus nonylphenolicus TaxID=1008307 RepID=UPI0036F336A8
MIALLFLIPVLGSVIWFNRIDLLLAFVKYQSQKDANIGPNREVVWAQGPSIESSPDAERPPNIILIVADDLGFNDISTFGGGLADGRVQTPSIDQLAAEGAVFTQAYAGNATCAPSRAMIMTGRYQAHTGYEFTPMPSGMAPIVSMVANSLDTGLPTITHPSEEEGTVPFDQMSLPSEEVTIAEILQDNGYQTAHIGKWHLGYTPGSTPNDQGFDESLLLAGGLYLPEDDPNVVNARVEFDPIDRFLWSRLNYGASFNTGTKDRFEPKGYLTDYYTNESIKFIQANRNQPFFLYLAHWGPHTPLQATREDYEAVGDIKPHRLRVYAAMIRAIDRSVGEIMAALEAEGLAENTVVMFTSDNGGAGYIGLEDVNKPFRGWKATMFEGGLRVPMFVKWPANIPAGTKIDAPVAHIDMMPTLSSVASAELPESLEIDGVDLMPLATGESEELGRKTLFWQSSHYRAVRHGDWKLQVSERPNKAWLYNLVDDPTEQNNLAELRKDKYEELMALLVEHRSTSRKPLYPSEVEMPVTIDKSLAQPYQKGDEYIYWPN